MDGHPFFTIGHSNRSLEAFLELVRRHSVELVVDVRRLPGSTRYPQFNADALGEALGELRVGFTRSEGLTGRRPASRTVPFAVNAWWENRSFHIYADHALSSEFRDALAAVRAAGSERPTAVMCSEAVWWRCHRRIIADHLLAAGVDVRHILGPADATPATLSRGAVVTGNTITYPAAG